MFFKIGVLKNFGYHRKTPMLEPLFKNVADPMEECYLSKYPLHIAKFLRTPLVVASVIIYVVYLWLTETYSEPIKHLK